MSLFDELSVGIKELSARRIIGESVLNGWQVRTAEHIAPREYKYFGDWKNLDIGDVWAKKGQTAFMRRTVCIPSDWVGVRVGLEMMTGGEGLLRIGGEPYHGVDDNRGYILLTPDSKGGETYDCEIEIRTGGYLEYTLDVYDWMPPSYITKAHVLSQSRLTAIDPAVEDAYYDFKVVYDAAQAEKDPTLANATLLAIKKALQEVDFRDTNAPGFVESLRVARVLLKERLEKIEFGDCGGKIFFTGHSHIDLAWLWPLKETMRKVGRTYSTVTALMDEYPEYYFNCSQVPLFLYLKEYFPTVYEKVKARVAEGRFEPVGGTWVENDCNVVSGESMVRQCLYGQRFFRNEFGVDVRVGWLPDVFGYSWAMPQIYRKSGLDYFMTVKIGWNDTNKFPYNTFHWQGVDGTKLLTHIPCDRYNHMVKPDEVQAAWDNYSCKLESPEFLAPFGWGDGGGGPTREMLEYLPRMKDIPGLPKAVTGRVHDFFDHIVSETSDLPVWNGELYFERHRGTYTSQSRNKRYNRKSELLYREAELYSSFAQLFGGGYPKEDLIAGWQTILLNQFHDIIPGSSITEVYRASSEQYEQVLAAGDRMRGNALSVVESHIDTSGGGTPVVVFNSLSQAVTGIAEIEAPCADGDIHVVGPNGETIPHQVSGSIVSFIAENVPSCGYSVYRILPGQSCYESPFTVEGRCITTPYYELTSDSNGALTRLYDRIHDREVLRDGDRANVLQVFEDKPSVWDAWDIEMQYQDKTWEFEAAESPRVIECGPAKLVLALKLEYGKSVIKQQIVLYAHSPRIDFVNEVDWQERRTLLKAAFPVEIHATRATYEIAFGAIERPNHWNTSWDKARFEVSGHRWADLSEADYGVSILNDCKYGWDIKDNVIRLTLLRSPIEPDREADLGSHKFIYSILPHESDWKNGTVQAGLELNSPLQAMVCSPHRGDLGASHSFVSVDRPNVIVDTIKQAEDDDSLIVRVYEAHGARGPVALSFDRPLESAVECNLLEEEQRPVDADGSSARFNIKPFEIRTFKIRFG